MHNGRLKSFLWKKMITFFKKKGKTSKRNVRPTFIANNNNCLISFRLCDCFNVWVTFSFKVLFALIWKKKSFKIKNSDKLEPKRPSSFINIFREYIRDDCLGQRYVI